MSSKLTQAKTCVAVKLLQTHTIKTLLKRKPRSVRMMMMTTSYLSTTKQASTVNKNNIPYVRKKQYNTLILYKPGVYVHLTL